MADTAFVHILDVPYNVDKTYEYYIPSELRETCVPGCVVEVPFGGANRRMTAVVIGYGECDENTTESIRKLKPVSAVMTDGEVLNREMLDLCRFVKEYTLCTFGDAVHACVPPAALTKITVYYSRTEKDVGNTKLSDRDMSVYNFIKERDKLTKQRISEAFAFDTTLSLKRLEYRYGLIISECEVKSQGNVLIRETVTLIVDSLPDEDKNKAIKSLRSENHKNIIEFLKKNGTSDYDEIADELKITKALAKSASKALEKRGIVKIDSEEIYRNHFVPDENEIKNYVPSPLSEEQSEAYNKIVELYESGKPKGALLYGVTGSGKTNVIMSAIDRVLEDGRGVIMLVPEIALTPQTVGRFMARYGKRIAVIHSGLSQGERYDAWRRIKEGLADVVIGTRSAVFAPIENIGMIIIDEEHEYTYKSDTDPKYHAHDIARFRCGEHKAVMLLASATPSVTSYFKAVNGNYTLIELKNRYGGAVLPDVKICDMRGSSDVMSPLLADRIRQDKKDGNQSILFLNRRGYNNYVSCRSCGKSLKCPHCSVTMTYHTYNASRVNSVVQSGMDASDFENERRNSGYLVCHMCGARMTLPDTCPECGKEHFTFMGAGTQRVEDDIEKMFPESKVIRMDTDTTKAKYSHEVLLDGFRKGESDILLGTQMVTKGHDFPKVATVGVLNADGNMTLDDYRANERTFAMITQVVGRAGRGDVKGCAIVQTHNPENEVLALAARQDYESFYANEIRIRKALCYPPYCDIAVITLSSADEGHLNTVTVRMRERIMEHINDDFGDVPLVMFGPFEAPVYKLQNIYRMRFVMKCRLNKRTREFMSALMTEFGAVSHDRKTGKKQRITVSVDLNPSTV